MAIFAARGHVNSGCCGDKAHQARRSDHNPDASGYAHAQDIHEVRDHDLQPYVRYVMANPAKFKHVKYMIYEGRIYYPNAGARPAGSYVYTGPNSHAAHLHLSIHANATFYDGSWYVDKAYGAPEPTPPEEEPMAVAIQHGRNFDIFSVDPNGSLVTRWFDDKAGAWASQVLATNAKVGAQIGIVRDYNGDTGRIDLAVEHATAGVIHCALYGEPRKWHDEVVD